MDWDERWRGLRRLGRPIKPFLRILGSAFYSQYGEDALAFIALRPNRRGFYVDVGAYDPIDGSNTYKFYLHGWRGLTVEPNPAVRGQFRLFRGGDTHVSMGVSAAPSMLRYFEFDIAMLNTTNEERAKSLEAAGYKIKRVREVACDTLTAILDQHAPGRHIDLLNVDCEGFDMEVMRSLDLNQRRPTVVMLEDLDGYFGLRQGGGESEAASFMRQHGYEPIARLLYSTIFVARDWRALNARSGAYNEAQIHPNLLPEPEAGPTGEV